MRRIIALAAAALLAAALGVDARGDEVVLKTGRTLAGRIVKEDDTHVTIQLRGGNMRLARDQIETIRLCPPPADLDAPPPAPSPRPKKADEDDGKPATSPGKKPAPSGKAPAPSAKKPAKRDRRDVARELLDELEQIRLVMWTDEETSRATEPGRKRYKIVRIDNSVTMRDERPVSPDDVACLYILIDSNDGMFRVYENGALMTYWRRLHWHPDKKEWRVNSPELETFQRANALADRIADLCCVDENGRIGAAVQEQNIKNARTLDHPPSDEKLRAKLVEYSVQAMGSEAGGELLAQWHEMTIAIDFAKLRTERIRLSNERRGLLRRLIDAAVAKKPDASR